jgi:hypothetical protein
MEKMLRIMESKTDEYLLGLRVNKHETHISSSQNYKVYRSSGEGSC